MKNTIENKAVEILKNGKNPHGFMRDLLIEMQLRELDKKEEADQV